MAGTVSHEACGLPGAPCLSTCVQSERMERRRHWWARLTGTNVEQRSEEYLGGGRWSEVDFLDFPESITDGSAWSSGSLRAQENKSGRKYQLLSFTIAFSHVRPAGERGKMKNKAAVRAPAFGELHLVDTDTAALGKNVPRATSDRWQCAPAPQRLIKERRQEEPPGPPARRPRPLTRGRGVAGTPMDKVPPQTRKVPACGASTS